MTQSRWIDNFVISTKPIGPVVGEPNPVLIKTPYYGPGKQAAWEAEAAMDDRGEMVVWQSKPITDAQRVRVDAKAGRFAGALAQRDRLGPGQVYYFRVRQQSDGGAWSPWSDWHQPLRTEGERRVGQAER